ncbi:helix-turn-helix transcriptional regulator [Propionimicrobium sp. PCR01-08-3]|uniref:helix-turn-helix domain-containing protein n=1 Tax=Propionimicrobium sp. PCR01-08-3 TaxID=3052086 RepID=UPI00255CDACA|nr:helix-turn-helix transcriptional regulator [Propionimicrobium sp. PCR01-08-3]WIY84298.1 helix-turn-helix transcriptional regulator [Propionimicrobium sp. PCR01-08-3]
MTEYGDSFNAAVAAELRAQRARRQITVEQLTSLSGLGRTSVLNYLNAKRDIPMPAFMDLCRVLGVSPHEIFDAAEHAIEKR